MSADIFTQLSVVIVIAAIVAYIMRVFKQPLIIGYILTGILVGPSFLHLISSGNQAFESFSDIGIALLLFIIGLELSLAVIRKLGKPVLLTALALLLTIGTIGYLVGIAFHFTPIESLLAGLAMFFSSTIIIAKVLSDKKEITRLNGQIAIGIILLDDIVATFALLFVAAGSGNSLDGVEIALLLVKGALVIAVLAFLSIKILPKATKSIAKSQELLFLFALAWGFGVASIINYVGFSVEIGALFAGVALAHLPYARQIGARLKPLRDFFVILFFISLGEHLQIGDFGAAIIPALVISAIVIILKPLVVMLSLGLMGYTRRTSFKVGINLSQISEFSIILIILAAGAGMVGENLLAIITLVALITITVSTYLMQYDNIIYKRLEKHLNMFEQEGASDGHHHVKNYPLVLIGFKNGGHQYLKTFRSLKKRFVVVDYDPEVIEELERANINFLYGDATDPELLAELNMEKVHMIVNTVGDHEVNMALVRYVRRRNDNAVIVCYSNDYGEAAELYRLGVSYVMLPHFIGSERLNSFITTHGISRESFDNYREKHMLKIGHTALKHR